jgi:hypothetical protein
MARTQRRQIRLTAAELRQIADVAHAMPHAASPAELLEQLTRRGLLLTAAQACAVSGNAPTGMTPVTLARLAALELAGVLPLLRRHGCLALLGLDPADAAPASASPLDTGEIDAAAAEDVADLSGGAFL